MTADEVTPDPGRWQPALEAAQARRTKFMGVTGEQCTSALSELDDTCETLTAAYLTALQGRDASSDPALKAEYDAELAELEAAIAGIKFEQMLWATQEVEITLKPPEQDRSNGIDF